MIILKCDVCGVLWEVRTSPAGTPIAPHGWRRHLRMVARGRPCEIVHTCGPTCAKKVGVPAATGAYWGKPTEV